MEYRGNKLNIPISHPQPRLLSSHPNCQDVDGQETSEDVLWNLAPGHWQWVIWVLCSETSLDWSVHGSEWIQQKCLRWKQINFYYALKDISPYIQKASSVWKNPMQIELDKMWGVRGVRRPLQTILVMFLESFHYVCGLGRWRWCVLSLGVTLQGGDTATCSPLQCWWMKHVKGTFIWMSLTQHKLVIRQLFISPFHGMFSAREQSHKYTERERET